MRKPLAIKLYFDLHKDDTDARSFVKTWLEEATATEKASRYAVVLHNDPLNSMEYVVKVIQAVFAYSVHKSVWLMLKAHFTGRSALWVGSRREADRKRGQMIAHGPDPKMIAKGAQPLSLTIEKVD